MFEIGARVLRVEDSPTRGAVVLEKQSGEAVYYLIAYDEGGEGWWPETALVQEGE